MMLMSCCNERPGFINATGKRWHWYSEGQLIQKPILVYNIHLNTILNLNKKTLEPHVQKKVQHNYSLSALFENLSKMPQGKTHNTVYSTESTNKSQHYTLINGIMHYTRDVRSD